MRWVLLGIAGAVLTGCANRLAVPTHNFSGADESPASVVLRATDRCFWFEAGDGTRFSAVWPKGYYAEQGPPMLLFDEQGRALAAEGDSLDVDVTERAGTSGPCSIGSVTMLVGAIKKVNGAAIQTARPPQPTTRPGPKLR